MVLFLLWGTSRPAAPPFGERPARPEPNMFKKAARTIAGQIPAIDRLIRQRDSLLYLAERYYGSDGNRKPVSYLTEYERLFAQMRNSPVRVLELGVRFGASMFLWSHYFPNATIVGLDIADKPSKFPTVKRVHFVQGSQDDTAALDKCAAVAGGRFDIIIDDASHIGQLTAASFSHLFPRHLNAQGFYIIEDICTAFLSEFPDSEPFAPAQIGSQMDAQRFPSHLVGMVGVVKQLFDHIMAPVAQGSYSTYHIERMLIMPNIAIVQKANLS
jgi:cephalosporin hydroxylase